MRITILGLSITSSWGNGHATTYRALVSALARRGHRVVFLERDVPWYAENRDLPQPPYCHTALYRTLDQLKRLHRRTVAESDLVVVGSYVPEGVEVGRWVTRTAEGMTAFYDIDTPVTLAKLRRGEEDYLSAELIGRYDLYLSFTGGPLLERLERQYGSPMARALYCSADPRLYRKVRAPIAWELGYLGTYSPDRQPALERLLLRPARAARDFRFAVAGALYPRDLRWPKNVARVDHLSPPEHARFYSAQRFTLNLTRADMRRAGWSPSVRLFEASACGCPIITDWWEGLDRFLSPGTEILVARTSAEVLGYLHDLGERERLALAARARRKVLHAHTAARRAVELERYVAQARAGH